MKRHQTDFLSLTFGLLFAGIGLVLLSGDSGAVSLAWVGPLTAIALGGLLLLAARSTPPAPDQHPAEE